MILSNEMYVPALRWRQGEYQALLRLHPAVKEQIVPLISIPEVEFDFELWQPKKTVHEHVHPFVARYKAKWGNHAAWIALSDPVATGRMNNGQHVFEYIFDGLRTFDANAIPAVQLSADSHTLSAAAGVVTHDGNGAGVLIRLEDLIKGGPKNRILSIANTLGIGLDQIDVIIDLKAPNFEPYDVFANALIIAMRKLGDPTVFRNLILIGTAIPESFKDIAKGTDQIDRHEWLFYQTLLKKLPSAMRRPTFGDYTIVHPDFVALDMRKIKAAGKIVYTTRNTWGVRKGGAFRDNPTQMHQHCAEIVGDALFDFRGQAFSKGDEYIAKCATHAEGHSNLTRWKDVGINHHITLVCDDLAKLTVSP